MKALLALALLLVFAGLLFQYHTGVHPLYSSQTEQYRNYMKYELAPKINSMNTTWRAGYNARFDGMDYDAIKTLNGALIDEQPSLPIRDEVANDIPASFDSRTVWPNCQSIQEVRDQANCGSCWAFGAAEAASDRYCVATGKQDRISSEDLVSCCKYCGNGCNGGYPTMAWAYFKNTGLCTGDLYGDKTWCRAYSLAPCNHHVDPPGSELPPCSGEEDTPKCKKQCDSDSTYTTKYKDDLHHGSSAYSIAQNVSAIQTDIQKYGPIECAFNVYEDFYTYQSGVYQHQSGSYQGGHAIKMLGWGEENGTPYWLCANSWNNNWGDNGFFKILRGKDECGIERSCVAGQI